MFVQKLVFEQRCTACDENYIENFNKDVLENFFKKSK